MSRADGTVFGGADGPDDLGPDPSAELRRWRLVARLAEHRLAAASDVIAFATAAADLLATELGDLAAVIVLEPAAGTAPVAALAHHNPDRAGMLEWLRGQSTPEQVRRLVHYMGADSSVVIGIPPAGENGTYQVYDREIGIDGTAYAALRRGEILLGGISCTRDRGSGRFTASDLSAIAAAADTISLLLDAAAARREAGVAEQQQSAAFDAAPIGMANIGLDGVVQTINHVGCLILGRRRDDVIGRPWHEFAHPDDVASDSRFMADAVASGLENDRGSTRRIIRHDGSTRWLHVTSQFLRDAQSEPAGFHTQFADVTNQFLAEAEADRLATLVHSSPDFVAIATLDERLAFVNAAGRALVGLGDDADVTAASLRDFIVEDDLGTAEFDTVGRDQNWEGVSTLRDWRDGSVIPVLATSFVLHDLHTGEPTAIATVRRDIREQLADRVEVERLSEQRRKLLTELVSAEQNERRRIAEDLHDESVQLLAAGQLRLQLLNRQLETGDHDSARTSAHDIADLVITALQRLREILLDLEPPTGPGHALHDSLGDVAQRLFAGSAIAVHVRGELADPSPEAAMVLYRAAREALSNARRHADATEVSVLLEDREGSWAVTVDDDGIGIPSEVPRRRGHLGLAGMTSRVEALGGSTSIGLRPGGGTRVELVVPRRITRRSGERPSPE